MRQQSDRPGPIGDAAGIAVGLVNRSANLLHEVSAEISRATSGEATAAGQATPGKRRSRGHKGDRRKPKSARQDKPFR